MSGADDGPEGVVGIVAWRAKMLADGNLPITLDPNIRAAFAADIEALLATNADLERKLIEAVTCLTWIESLGYGGAPDIAMRRAARASLKNIAALNINAGEAGR